MKYPQARLLVLSKAPEPGRVKTRLGSHLGMEAAALLYEKLVHECLATCVSADLCPVDICCEPSPQHPFFQHCSSHYQTGLQQQQGSDLGQRMSAAIQLALKQAELVVLIGGDCPWLTAGDLDTAILALQQGSDVVLGPAEDGGYYLIGMKQHYPELFHDMPWGTDRVLAITETRLHQQGLTWHRLARRRDLDTAEDYDVYMSR